MKNEIRHMVPSSWCNSNAPCTTLGGYLAILLVGGLTFAKGLVPLSSAFKYASRV